MNNELFKLLSPRGPFAAGLGLIIFQLILLGVSYPFLPPQVPLFYSRPWGEAQLAAPFQLFLLPGLSLAIWLVNGVLSNLIGKKEFFSSLLGWGQLLANFFASMALIKILLRVF